MITIEGLEVLARIGSGGMGDVYLARRRRQEGFEKLLAVKTIRSDLAKKTQLRSMFFDEARLSAHFTHPNIRQVYELREEQGSLYLIMEYVAGVTLRKILTTHGRVAPLVAAKS